MFNSIKKFGARAGAALLVGLGTATAAMADAGIDAALDAVDLAGIAVKVGAAGVVIVGIAMAFKGPVLAKRVINRV